MYSQWHTHTNHCWANLAHASKCIKISGRHVHVNFLIWYVFWVYPVGCSYVVHPLNVVLSYQLHYIFIPLLSPLSLYLQALCEHFESVLKITTQLKSMLSKFPQLSSQTRKSGIVSWLDIHVVHTLTICFIHAGIISVLPNSEQLASVLYSSCVKLIHHIADQSKVIIASPATSSSSREVHY